MATLEHTYVCQPATERGRGILIGGDAASSTITYCNAKLVILRSLVDPLHADVYDQHSHNTTVARISPNGEWVASGDVAGHVRVWARKPELDYKLKLEIKALGGSIDDLQWSVDGQRILVAGDGKNAQPARCFIWDTGNNVGSFEGHSKRALSCALRPIRPFRIATAGEDFLVNFYTGPPFAFTKGNREHSNFVNCVRYSPNGSKFATVGSDSKICMFEGTNGDFLGSFPSPGGHTGSVYAASWSPDGSQLLTVSADKTAKVWDVSDSGEGRVHTTFHFSSKPKVEDMQVGCLWLSDYLITVSLSGDINFLSSAHPENPSRVLSGHTKAITSLCLDSVGASTGAPIFFSCSYDGVVMRWQAGRGDLGRVGGKGHGTSLAALVVGGGEVVSCGLDDKVRRTPLPCEEYTSEEGIPLGAQPCGLAMAGSQPTLLLCPTSSSLVLLRGKKVVSTLPVPFTCTAAALSPDGFQAIVGGGDGKLRVYAVEGDTLREEHVLERHREAITAVAYSPDGASIASGDAKPEALIWDVEKMEVRIKNLLYHTARITCLAWAPDSSAVVTGSLDNSLIIWDANSASVARKTMKRAHPGGVAAVVYRSPTRILSSGDDCCIREWDVSE